MVDQLGVYAFAERIELVNEVFEQHVSCIAILGFKLVKCQYY